MWQDTYFDDNYIDFYQDIITPDRTAKEVDFLLSVFDRETKTVLDVPCGFGRHAIALARKGYVVHGIDGYPSQLNVARENARGVSGISLEQADMRSFRTDATYDAVLNLFTSFGYFTRHEDMQVLKNIVDSARPGGLIILDTRNPVRLLKELADEHWTSIRTTPSDQMVDILDPVRMVHTMTYEHSGTKRTAVVNLYMPSELIAAFEHRGCTVEHLYGNFDRSDYDPLRSVRLIIVARRS